MTPLPFRAWPASWPWRLALAALVATPWHAPVLAQDAARGARLYLGLPGGEASCVECHGPDPGADRNRLLNAARGPSAIDEALRKAAAMGYLSDLLLPADRADLSAFLSLVAAQAEGRAPAEIWPWGVEFGRVAPGSAPAMQQVRLVNRGSFALAVSPRLRELAPPGANGASTLALTHDCPAWLPPGEGCTARIGLVAGSGGRVQAVLTWDDAAALRPVGIAAHVVDGPLATALWSDTSTPSDTPLQAAPGAEATTRFTLRTTGPATLVLGVPAITGPGRAVFRLEGGGCAPATALPPAAACTVRVRAVAPPTGQVEALLQWRNDGGHPPPLRLVVQAVGPAEPGPVAPPPPAPAPSPAPAPPPAPDPSAGAPVPAPPADRGGGCSRSGTPASGADALLPGLLLAAVAVAWARRRPTPRGPSYNPRP